MDFGCGLVGNYAQIALAFTHPADPPPPSHSARSLDCGVSPDWAAGFQRPVYQPHHCEHLLHRTLIAATNHLKTARERTSYVRYLQLKGGGVWVKSQRGGQPDVIVTFDQ